MRNSGSKLKIWGGGFAAALALAALPAAAYAETVVRTGDSVSIGVNQSVENNLYAAAGSVSLSGEVKADMYAVAGTVTVNGPVGADLTVLGGTAQVHSSIGDDTRIIAGDAVVSGEVGGDLFVIGGRLSVLSSAKVAGNVYFYGGEAAIEGRIEGQVVGRSETFFVNGEVGGMDVVAMKVELGDSANVRGDLSYSSVSELSRAPGATVGGQIVRGAERSPSEGGRDFPVVFLVIWLFTSLCLFLLFRPVIERVAETARRDTLKVGLIGLVSVIAGPIIGVVLVATVLGVWLGVLKLLVTAILFIITMMVLPAVLGSYLLSFWKPGRRLDIWTVLAGMLAVVALNIIPFGGLLVFVAYAVTIGSILYLLYQKTRGLI